MAVTDQMEDKSQALPAPAEQKALPETTEATAPASTVNSGGLMRRLILVVILLVAGLLVYWRIHTNNAATAGQAIKMEAAANRPVPVTVSPVELKTMPIYLTELGSATAYNTVIIKSRVDGQLLSVNVQEGQKVRKGQVLATIDPRPYQAAVAQAQGQLAKDQAAANNANLEASRYAALFKAGVISKESAQTQESTAGQSAGSLDADRAAIQAAQVNLNYTRITSPIDGVVGLRQVDAGNIVHASDATGLLVVTQLQPIAVIFTLPEDQVPQVQALTRDGKKLAVDAYDRSETKHLATGSLLTLDNQIDPTTGTVKAKAIFDNADNALFPNQFVNVRLVLEQRQNSLVIPAAALQTGSNGTFVYVVRPGAPPHHEGDPAPAASSSSSSSSSAASLSQDTPAGNAKGRDYYVVVQPVVVDLTEGARVILKSGVQPGDQVVIDGQEKLKDGSVVEPQDGRSRVGGPGAQQVGTTSPDSRSDANPAAAGASRPAQAKPHQGRVSGAGNSGSGSTR
jgi:multidrug efflux system membrane fusion protein